MRNRGLLTELLGRPRRESMWLRVLGWAVRARAEWTVFTFLVSTTILLHLYTGMTPRQTLITETAVVVVVIMFPGARARVWAVTSRHRIWKCFVQTRTMTPDGVLPYLMWSRPSPVGERVHVWLPAGLSVNDLASITEALAAACYAAEARVEVNKRFTHLATITIARRDPFTGKRLEPIYTATVLPKHPRLRGTKALGTDSTGVFTPLPDRDSLPVPTAPAEHPTVTGLTSKTTERRTGARRTPTGRPTHTETVNSEPTTPPPVVGVGGMDVSDYV